MKSSFNDYSALASLFRDGVLGLVISTGITGTLLPNSVESIGQFRNLNSFGALNLFSVIYFVFPVLLMTSYWFIRGTRLYLKEKFSKPEADKLKAMPSEESNKNLIWRVIIASVKTVPIIIFIRDESFFETMWGMVAGFYLVCGIGQLIANYYFNKSWLSSPRMDMPKDRWMILLYRSYCMDGMIFFLDSILGLALVIFSAPWVFYSNSFYTLCNSFIVAYALFHWMWSYHFFKDHRKNPRDFVVTVIICAAGLTIPSVNLSGMIPVIIVVFSVLVFILLVSSWKTRGERPQKISDRWRNIGNVFIAVVPMLLLVLWFSQIMEEANLEYMIKRYQAAMEVPTNQVYPLDSKRAPSLDQQNRLVSFYPQIIERESKKISTQNLRSHYYTNYFELDTLFKNPENKIDTIRVTHRSQVAIDKYYDRIYRQVLDKREDSKNQLKGIPESFRMRLEKYAHPLDYMGGSLKEMRLDKEDMESMVNVAEELYRLSILNKSLAKDTSATARKLQDLISLQADQFKRQLKKMFENSVELRFNTNMIDNLELDSLSTWNQVKFQRLMAEYKELEYNKKYSSTQTVYRSYLVDSQRIGVWAFVVCIVIIGIATYFNRQDNELVDEASWGENPPKLPLDTPKNALLIQCLAIGILVVPLIRPIQPENIDPENPYWMISIQNWHAPTFIKSFSEPNGESRYIAGKTNVQTTVRNEISLDALKAELHQVANAIEKNEASTNAISNRLYLIQKQIANSQEQKNDGKLIQN